MQRGILFVDVVSTAGDAPENVMVFTTLDAETLAKIYRSVGVEFAEALEVPEEERQFYTYEPLWMSETKEAHALKLLDRYLLGGYDDTGKATGVR